jgi:hypothetical protein
MKNEWHWVTNPPQDAILPHRSRDKEKPHRFRPQTFGTESDAARPGWAEDRASAYLASLFLSIPGQVRVLFSSPETPDKHRYRIPGEID